MAMFTKENEIMIKLKAKELIIIVMALSILDNGWMINNMEVEKRCGQMELSILEIMLMARKREKEASYGLMALSMKAISIKIVFMGMELIHGQMVENT